MEPADRIRVAQQYTLHVDKSGADGLEWAAMFVVDALAKIGNTAAWQVPNPFEAVRFTVQLTLKSEHAAKLRDRVIAATDPVEALFDSDAPDWPIWNVSNYDVGAVDIS